MLGGVRLGGADDVVLDRLLRVDVAQPHEGADRDNARVDLIRLDDARAGESLLIRGDLVPDELDRGTSRGATEVWVPGSETGTIDGVFVLAKDNGLRCITAPCPSVGETRLNANRTANISGIDLTPSGADQETIDRAYNGMYDGGVILVGDREYGARNAKLRTANQFWTKAPVPLH